MRYHHFCVPLFPKSDFCAVWILQLPPSIGEAMVGAPVFHSVNSSQHSYSGHLIILSNNVLLISTLESRQCFRLLSNSDSNYFRVPALLEGELALSAVSKTDGRITQSDADESLLIPLVLTGRGDRFGKSIVGWGTSGGDWSPRVRETINCSGVGEVDETELLGQGSCCYVETVLDIR